jgi:hypothetical protein
MAFAVVPGLAPAQDATSLIRGAIEVLQREGKLPPPPGVAFKSDPLEPQGHPGLTSKDQRLPPPAHTTQRLEVVEHGGVARRFGDRFILTGGVQIRYRGYDMWAEEIQGSTKTNIFTATGNVRVIGLDAVVTGERITVNFDENTFRAENGDAQIRASFLQGRVLDDIYLRGGVAYGSEREIWGEDTHLTTCNLDHPHYELKAARSNLRPGRRLILRKVDINILGHKVLSVPYVSIPLDNSGERYLPEVGQSPDEGYYIKNRIGVPLRGDDGLVARLDYMTKLGAGLGGDYRYDRPYMNGSLGAYAIIGQINTLNIENQHNQQIGSGTLNLSNNFQRNNYLNSPQSTIFRTEASYLLPQGHSTNTRATLSRYSNESGPFHSVNQTFGLADDRQWGQRTRTQSNVNLVQNTSGSTGATDVTREQVDVRFRGSHDLKKATAELEYIRSIPIGETANFFSPADRTPVLALRSDARRLFGDSFNRTLPFTTELSLGEFVSRTTDRITRANFDLNWQKRDTNTQDRHTLNFNGRFRQGIYSDDTAQYIAGLGTDYSYRLGAGSERISLRYNFLRPYGFSPLSIDRVGRTNFLSADVNFRPLRPLLVGVGTGYDFLREEREEIAWQTAGLRAEYTPTNWLQMRGYSTYDPIRHAFSSVKLDFFYFPGATQVLASFRYDGIRHTWSNANVTVNGFKWGRLNTSVLLNYNGFLKKFEARHFSFTYDLHCAEAILQIIDNPTGFRAGRQIAFFIRLKALPIDTPFGTGTRGQPVGFGSGYTFGGGG